MTDDTLTLDGVEINDWTQPMHLFIGGEDTAVCGMSLKAANNQRPPSELGDEFTATKFPASDNAYSIDELREYAAGEGDFCAECLKVLADDE